eukprot:CAMPEP_0117427020 /NCGR_PEP_ID=MMETSP0758-20121206/6972_1 /TAXON_ID=63605 /ORGANISM="Percolomonas cosmopolitus, Strain AE-1 (ATCC 50343)" /LENGTH=166 /DNA_ID=CAMNT_0005212447 /DNA_START=416 /DNA_END=916 /DNA_ORIENTATION=-
MALNLWKLKFSEKWVVFSLCLQLSLASFPHSLIAAVCGLIPGLLYRLPGLRHHVHKLVPSFITSFFTRRVYSRLNPDPFRVRNHTMEEQTRQDTDAQVARTFGQSRTENAANEQEQDDHPDTEDEDTGENDITTLVEMGFDEARARQALLMANGDVQLATALLLES